MVLCTNRINFKWLALLGIFFCSKWSYFRASSSCICRFTIISLVALLGLIGSPKDGITLALSGFSNSVIWLIFNSIYVCITFTKKQVLEKRVSLIMIKHMGKSSLGLGYAVAFSDLVLAHLCHQIRPKKWWFCLSSCY